MTLHVSGALSLRDLEPSEAKEVSAYSRWSLLRLPRLEGIVPERSFRYTKLNDKSEIFGNKDLERDIQVLQTQELTKLGRDRSSQVIRMNCPFE